MFFVYFIIVKKSNKERSSSIFYNHYLYIFLLAISLLTIFFTKSQGAWIGIFSGLVVFLFLIGYKKISIGILVITACLSILIPSARSVLFFQDVASSNRILLWNQSWSYLTASPSNFVLGTGIRQFYDKIQKPTHDWKRIERHIYPHNIFLNFWTEIGLLGMLSFIGILSYLFILSIKMTRKGYVLGPVIFSLLITMIVHGLVDVPYFKNDLSFLFWTISAISVMSYVAYNDKIYEV